MLFIDLTQASQGEQRATDNAFKNYNALIAADVRTTQAQEFNAGAPGRLAAAQLESDRQVGLAEGLAPDLQTIIEADINQIQGQAALRNNQGLLNQEIAAFQLPNIPTLAGNTAGIELARSNNQLNQVTVLDAQQQAINENLNTNTLNQQPTQFAIEAGQNQTALALQKGEREYALAKQRYDQNVLNGAARNLPLEQALERQRLGLEQQRTTYNSSVVTQQQSVLPTQNQLQNADLAGQVARSPLEQRQLLAQQQTATGDAEYQQRAQAQMQAIATQQRQILASATSYEALSQPQKQQLQTLQRNYEVVRQAAANRRQPILEGVTDTQAAGQAARADSVQRTANLNQVVQEGEAQYTADNLRQQQNLRSQIARIRQRSVGFQEETQEDRQEIQRLENQLRQLRAQTAVNLQPGQANVAKTQQEIQQLEADRRLDAQPDIESLERITRSIQLGDLRFEELQAPVQQAIRRDQRLVQQSNLALTLRMVPKTTRIREMQLGQTIFDLNSAQKLQGYAYTAREITARGKPSAAQAQLNEQNFRNSVLQSTRAIQRLSVMQPTAMTASQLSQTTRVLRDNEFMTDTQTLSVGPQGVFIKTPGQADRPLNNLYSALVGTTSKSQNPKPTQYKVSSYVTEEGDSVPVYSVESFGAPPTDAATQAFLNRGAGTVQADPADAFIGPNAGQVSQQNLQTRGF